MNTFQWQNTLHLANQKASIGRFDEALALCRDIHQTCPSDQNAIITTGSFLLACGFVSFAKLCFQGALDIDSSNFAALANLAAVEQQLGNSDEAIRIYTHLKEQYPLHEGISRNYILSLEYCPQISDQAKLEAVKDWANLAISLVGGKKSRPVKKGVANRPLRVGYVSSDFCQHTVGIFFKEILRSHNKERIEAYTYSSGSVTDWITEIIQAHSNFRQVSHLSNAELAQLIENDHIDVLIDLSGHTAGSRLSMFAHRPAPIMLSWLGYFATTGLEYMDAVLLDRWHCSDSVSEQFIEPIAHLSQGRLCFYPAFPAPLLQEPPSIKNGFITFGSFNNTLKYNAEVYSLWTKILHAVPGSRLILKWRTFNDPEFCNTVRQIFEKNGIAKDRIELRGPSFHIYLLDEYKDIDIALDPFPFSGGLTSCEALYMGVPVITLPQDRVVSRQTYAFLSSIGHTELAAKSVAEYLEIAKNLASSPQKLIEYRNTLRDQMINSSLMKPKDFTKVLEDAILEIFNKVV